MVKNILLLTALVSSDEELEGFFPNGVLFRYEWCHRGAVNGAGRCLFGCFAGAYSCVSRDG
jgi:hypothetical protein